jgi:ABC-type sugar transport system ATPase subunit
MPGTPRGNVDAVSSRAWREQKLPGVVALKNLDLDLYAGEVVAICGANGAGKSTFARLLSGQEPTSSGEIRVQGRDKPIQSQREAFEAGVLLLHQEPLIIDDFTVGENVWLYSLRDGGANAWAPSPDTNGPQTQEALQAVGLSGMATWRLGSSLAPGQRQMLALTRAVVNKHRVLILDETTASTTESYFELVRTSSHRRRPPELASCSFHTVCRRSSISPTGS